jgi:hypothetical protein
MVHPSEQEPLLTCRKSISTTMVGEGTAFGSPWLSKMRRIPILYDDCVDHKTASCIQVSECLPPEPHILCRAWLHSRHPQLFRLIRKFSYLKHPHRLIKIKIYARGIRVWERCCLHKFRSITFHRVCIPDHGLRSHAVSCSSPFAPPSVASAVARLWSPSANHRTSVGSSDAVISHLGPECLTIL